MEMRRSSRREISRDTRKARASRKVIFERAASSSSVSSWAAARDPPAGAQHVASYGQFVRRGADVVQDEVPQVDEFAVDPQRGPRLRENLSGSPHPSPNVERAICPSGAAKAVQASKIGRGGNRGRFGGRLFGVPLREVCINEVEPYFVAPGGFRAGGKS